MAKPRGESLAQLSGEATRYAGFYFDPVEQARMPEEQGRPVDGDYAVLVKNRFVPIDWVPDSAAVLRKFVRGGGSALDAAELETLKEYWRELDAAVAELSAMFEAGESTASVKAAARGKQTWPAVGVAELLMTQFEAILRSDVAWRCVDSSTYPTPKPDGIYVVIEWFWHGW